MRTDRQTGRQTDRNLTVAFRNFANVPIKAPHSKSWRPLTKITPYTIAEANAFTLLGVECAEIEQNCSSQKPKPPPVISKTL
jgi:hypothetical protein